MWCRPGTRSAVLLLGSLATGPTAGDEAVAGTEALERSPVHTVVPAYPEKARRERLEGEVQVCFYVDRRGRPYRIAVRNSTHRLFERPSIQAVRASTYAPLADDEPLPNIKSCRTFSFRLTPVAPVELPDTTSAEPDH